MSGNESGSASQSLGKYASKVASAEKLRLAERRRRVASLRMRHMSTREIARLLEVSIGTVHKDIQAVETEWHDDAQESMEKHTAKELAILNGDESMLRNTMATSATTDLKLRVYDRILRVIERRAKLLGLDAPIRMDLARAEAKRLAEEFDLDEGELVKMAEEIMKQHQS